MRTDLREPLKPEDSYLICLVLIVVLIVGMLICSGCMQTIHGMASDIRSASTYVEEHTVDDK